MKSQKLCPLNRSVSRPQTPLRRRTEYPTPWRVGWCKTVGSLFSGGTPRRHREPCC